MMLSLWIYTIGSVFIISSFLAFNSYKIAYVIVSTTRKPEQQEYIQIQRKYLANYAHVQPYTVITCDMQQLAMLIINRPQARHIIVICHGYRQAKEHYADLISLLPDDTLVLFDFRAHGESTGNYTTFGDQEVRDIQAVLQYIYQHRQLSQLPVIAIGFSMGAAALLHAIACGAHVDALILDSPFESLVKSIRYRLCAKYRFGQYLMPLTMYAYYMQTGSNPYTTTPALWAGLCTIPVLVIHSAHDPITPYIHALTLYKQLRGKKYLWISHAHKHCMTYKEYPQLYQQYLHAFINNLELIKT